MEKLLYPACFYPVEEGGYTVIVPDLQGCVTEGNDLQEAIDMAIDAASGWILDEWENGKTVPPPSDIKDVQPDSKDGFVNLIVLDMEAYAEKYGEKAVRKNVTIPAWLNTFAERKHINFSKLLRDSLLSLYEKENA